MGQLLENVIVLFVGAVPLQTGDPVELLYHVDIIPTAVLGPPSDANSKRTLLRAIASRMTDILFFHTFTSPNTWVLWSVIANILFFHTFTFPNLWVLLSVIIAIQLR